MLRYATVTRAARLCLSLAGALLSAAAIAAGSDALPDGAKAGDLIFREGTEAVSDAVMTVDGGGFSHVGMLLGEPGNWQVIHATPSEVPGRPDGVVIDPLAFFTDPKLSRRHVVYHVGNAAPAQRERAVAAARSDLGKPFRLADPAGTYCTTLVWQAWQEAGLDLEVEFTPLAIPLMPGNYLLPGRLAASPHLQALAETAGANGLLTPVATSLATPPDTSPNLPPQANTAQ
ncbi:YiiX/YebB-like N1pC/P60 family cysteine hydrolase [Kerstersia similis]|uniref:YiiX/YebB-like N1pC/P60 family cysteine hydrolase n=1 Tax=Kerstersia similis TaxID=206505 RepID=UPI0039EF7B09